VREVPGEEETFRECLSRHLKHCAKQRGTTVNGLIKAFPRIRDWYYKRQNPTRVPLERLEALERFLDVPAGTFQRYGTRLRARDRRWSKTEYGEKLSRLLKKRYRIPAPPHIDAYLADLTEYKTADSPELQRTTEWTVNARGDVPSADIVRSAFENLIGWMCLARASSEPALRGLGKRPEEINVLDLYDAGLWRKYWTEFRKPRSGGYSKSVLRDLAHLTDALRPVTGYIWQRPAKLIPQLKKKLRKKTISRAQFHGWAKVQRDSFVKFKKDIENKIEPGRPALDDLRDILKLQHPLLWIEDLAHDMIAALPPRKDVRYPRAFQRVFLLVFLIYVPLRALTLSVLRRSDLRWDDERKRWVLKVNKKNFKNRRFIRVDSRREYVVVFPTSVNPVFDHFLNEVRPTMEGARAGWPYLFVYNREHTMPQKFKKRGRVCAPAMDGPVRKHFLSQEIRLETIIHRERSMGLHWVRHALATEYLRNREDGIMTVARLFNEKPETIDRYYSDVKTGDYIAFFHSYVESTLERRWAAAA
jgi:hypothetical protein